MRTSLSFLLCVLLSILVLDCAAQFDRKTKKQQWLMTGTGFALSGGAYYLEQQVEPYSQLDLALLRSNTFGGINGQTVLQFSDAARSTSDVILFSSFALPAVALAIENGRSDIGNAMHVYLQTATLNFALASFTKSQVESARPYVYNPNAPMHLALESDAKMSFFSRHVSTVSSFSFLTAQFIQEYSNNKGLKTTSWIVAAVLPAVTGYLRMQAGEHFLDDVVAGYLVGAAVGIGIPRLHRNRSKDAKITP